MGEFTCFHQLLMKGAPEDYQPWYFKLEKRSKAPFPGRSWSAPGSRLPFKYAVRWMRAGGNIGIAGRVDDPLVNVDLDGSYVCKEVLKPTLITRSRSRTGLHGFYFTEDKAAIPNIPTDTGGEVRSQDQYVVAAGSYVPTDPDEVPQRYRDTAGRYTLEEARPPAWITYDELPEVFKKTREANKNRERKTGVSFDPVKAGGNHSALYTITAREVVLREGGETNPGKRWASLFHGSTTDANMSLSTEGLLHCWRHCVSHNGLTALVALSGYMTCLEAGTPHGGGQSRAAGDDGAIFHAWLYAKQQGHVPLDDPIPVRALRYIAMKHHGWKGSDWKLPREVYRRALLTVKEAY